MKVAYLSVTDPLNKRSWSGIHYQMYSALAELDMTVVPIGPIDCTPSKNQRLRRYNQILHAAHKIFNLGEISYSHTTYYSHLLSKETQQRIRGGQFDIIFAPAGSGMIAQLRTKTPIIYFSDATISLLIDFYPNYFGLSSFSKSMARNIEKRAIKNASAQIFSSNWARSSAEVEFNAGNTSVIPFGSNLVPAQGYKSEKVANHNTSWNLLFIGVDWKRKGGDLVVGAFNELLAKGKRVSLTIVGCNPPLKHEAIEIFPFLDKNKADDLAKLKELFVKSNLLILPTRADCSPIVIGEAYAFSTPVIVSDVGGVRELIEDRVTGRTLPLSSTSADYAKAIIELMENPSHYCEMSIAARQKFEEQLNWKIWAQRMKMVFQKTLQTKGD